MNLPNVPVLARVMSQMGPTIVEDFIASLVVADHSHARQVNSGGGGDGGIDIRLDENGVVTVWQVKNFASAVTNDQMRQIVDSVRTLARDVEQGHLALYEYFLVTPWTPTERRVREFAEASKALGCPATWHGAAYVRNLIASHPEIYDRAVHGDMQLDRYVNERALLAATSPGAPGTPGLSEAIVIRQRALKELETLTAGDYAVHTSHFTLRDGTDPSEIMTRLTGVAHRAEVLPGGILEVQSAVPTGDNAEPITIQFTVDRALVKDNEELADFLHWGVPPQAGMPVGVRITSGPFADQDVAQAVARMTPLTSPARTFPLLIWTGIEGDSADAMLELAVREVSSGMLGGGRRVVADSPSGMVTVELRMGSSEVGDSSSVALALAGGQPVCQAAEELGVLKTLSVEPSALEVEGMVLAKTARVAAPGALDAMRRLANSLCALSRHATEPFVMPEMTDLTEDDIREVEKYAAVAAGESLSEPWDVFEMTVRDAEQAQAFLSELSARSLVVTSTMGFALGGREYKLPYVLTKTVVGCQQPTAEELAAIRPGMKLKVRGEENAMVHWGVVVDDTGERIHPRKFDRELN